MKHGTNSIKVLIDTDGSQSVLVVFAGLAAETCWAWSAQLPKGLSADQPAGFFRRKHWPAHRGGEPIHLVGVEFSKANRNIVGFEVETIQNS